MPHITDLLTPARIKATQMAAHLIDTMWQEDELPAGTTFNATIPVPLEYEAWDTWFAIMERYEAKLGYLYDSRYGQAPCEINFDVVTLDENSWTTVTYLTVRLVGNGAKSLDDDALAALRRDIGASITVRWPEYELPEAFQPVIPPAEEDDGFTVHDRIVVCE